MQLAISMRTPDRVPVMCQLALGHYFLHSGVVPHKVWFTSEGFAQALVTMQKRYKFDGILINLPGRPANIMDNVVQVTNNPEGGEKIVWANGDYNVCILITAWLTCIENSCLGLSC